MWRKPTKYNEGYKNPLETSVKLDTRDIRPVAFHEDIDRRGHYLSLYETTTSPLSPHLLPASPPSLYSQGHAMKSVRARTNAPTIWSFGRVLTLHYRQQTVLSLYLVHILIIVFYRAIRLTGPFVTMVYSMITGDMLTFGIIYMVVLFGFCQSFYFLYKGFPGVKSSLYSSYHSTWMALFQITLGDYNVSHHSSPINHRFIVAIFFFFCTRVFFLFSFFFSAFRCMLFARLEGTNYRVHDYRHGDLAMYRVSIKYATKIINSLVERQKIIYDIPKCYSVNKLCFE